MIWPWAVGAVVVLLFVLEIVGLFRFFDDLNEERQSAYQREWPLARSGEER